MAGCQRNAPPVLLAFKDLAPSQYKSSSAATDYSNKKKRSSTLSSN